jgi:hypothetical protein
MSSLMRWRLTFLPCLRLAFVGQVERPPMLTRRHDTGATVTDHSPPWDNEDPPANVAPSTELIAPSLPMRDVSSPNTDGNPAALPSSPASSRPNRRPYLMQSSSTCSEIPKQKRCISLRPCSTRPGASLPSGRRRTAPCRLQNARRRCGSGLNPLAIKLDWELRVARTENAEERIPRLTLCLGRFNVSRPTGNRGGRH